MTHQPYDSRLEKEFNHFSSLLKDYSEADQTKIMDAACWGSILHQNQQRASGEPYFIHPLSVAQTLIEMKMDGATIIASLLHDIEEDTDTPAEEIIERYGQEVEDLVDGVTKISMSKVDSKAQQSNETIRKMFLAMTSDVRVILIKLADKLHNMTTLAHKTREKQIKTAQECLDIYTPLATKLGIYWLKMKLEDFCLSYLKPEFYLEIAQYLANHKEKASHLLQEIDQLLKQKTSFDFTVSIIQRNPYAIYRLLQTQKKKLNQLNYPYGIKLICKTQEDCYRMIGLVHSQYSPLDGKFIDFIAKPKENWYQGLHTTVMSKAGYPLEVQVETEAMDRINQHGITATWLFKQEIQLNPSDFALLKRVKSWGDLPIEANNFVRYFTNDDDRNMITLYTPQGNSQSIPSGSTALDYAFKLGRHIGLGCIDIEVDGYNVPFDTLLVHNQMVKVISNPTVKPKLFWLQQVNRSSSKEAIYKWYRKNNFTLIKTDTLIYAYPTNQKQYDKLTSASCCHPTPSHSVSLIKQEGELVLHRADCLQVNIASPSSKIETVWLKQKKILYHYKIEALYVRNLFALVEQAIYLAGGQLTEGILQKESNTKLTALLTFEVDDEAKQQVIKEKLTLTTAILKVETLESYKN